MVRESTKVIKKCNYCDKEYEVYKCEFNRRKYCSQSCRGKVISNKYNIKLSKLLPCIVCGKLCDIPRCRHKTFKFCSYKCQGTYRKGKRPSEDTIEKIRNGSLGRHHTLDTKKKLSLAKIGDLNPAKREDVREKIRLSKLGSKQSEDTKQKHRNFRHTEEAKAKIREKIILLINNRLKNHDNTIPNLGKNEKLILDKIENKIGLKIERQKLIDGYFVDGYIKELNLCIEVDENKHRYMIDKDKLREEYIKKKLNCKFKRVGDNMSKKTEEEYDKELDDFVKDTLSTDINQLDSIDPSVEAHVQEMGWLWDRVQKKMQEDNACFKCKKQIREDEKDLENKSFILQASNSEKGVVAFVSLCEKCFKEEDEKHGNKS